MRHLTLALMLITISCFAQDGHFQFGGRSAGLANASLTTTDSWSLVNNIGALGSYENTSCFAGYQTRYGVSDLQAFSGGFVHHTRGFTTGAGYYRFGGSLYNQQRIMVGVANKIQFVSLGAGVSVIQYHVESLQTTRKIAVEFGGLAEIVPQLVFGAHIFNLSQDAVVPTVMKAGMSYRPSARLMLNTEIEKDLSSYEVLRVGMEYLPVNPLYIRTGFSTRPFKAAYGLGINWADFLLDYAYGTNGTLGTTHDLSICYKISK